MHQRDVPVAARARLRELLLAGRGRCAVPVARVDVVGDDLVVERAQRGQHVAARGEVRRADVRGADADEVDEGLFELLDFGRELGGAEGAEVGGVRPGLLERLL